MGAFPLISSVRLNLELPRQKNYSSGYGQGLLIWERPGLECGLPSKLKQTDKSMADESTPKAPAAKPDDKAPAKAPAKAKKAKPPKLEDKPFAEFIEQHFLPAVKTVLEKEEGLDDLQISFETQPINIVGIDKDSYPQVIGRWANGERQFNIVFLEDSIKGPKIYSFSTNGATPSTIEQFMGDERRITLDLMVLYVLRRLKGQKWLKGN